jgi:hypothetical protein
MMMRISLLSLLSIVSFASATLATTVSFQNGFNGYNQNQILGFNGNGTPLPVHTPYAKGSTWSGLGYMDGLFIDGETWRNHIQLVRFDDIFGSGLDRITTGYPGGTKILSATLTLTQNSNVTYTFNAHRALLDWSESDLGINYDTDPGVRPRGPDRASGTVEELTASFITSNPAIPRDTANNLGGQIVFDMTADVQYFLDHPAERFGWGIVRNAHDQGIPFYANPTQAGVPLDTSPLLVVTFALPPAPEPSGCMLLGLGSCLLARVRRRQGAKR